MAVITAPTPCTVALLVCMPGCLSPRPDYSRASSCTIRKQLLHEVDLTGTTTTGSFSLHTRRSTLFWQALDDPCRCIHNRHPSRATRHLEWLHSRGVGTLSASSTERHRRFCRQGTKHGRARAGRELRLWYRRRTMALDNNGVMLKEAQVDFTWWKQVHLAQQCCCTCHSRSASARLDTARALIVVAVAVFLAA
jgi:hypothetical protein